MSAKMGKLDLTPEDLITSDDTDELFGQFGLQGNLDEHRME
jgi:hypothetical protein